MSAEVCFYVNLLASELTLTSLDHAGSMSSTQTMSSRILSMRLKCQFAVSCLIRTCSPLWVAFIDDGGLLTLSEQLRYDMITGELLSSLLQISLQAQWVAFISDSIY